MTEKEICGLLPEEPPEGLMAWAMERYGELELGTNLVIANCERRTTPASMEEIMEGNYFTDGKKRWVAVCRCPECGEEFETSKVPGEDAIRMTEGPDGTMYCCQGYNEADVYMDWGDIKIKEHEPVICPICGERNTLVFGKNIRGGRTKRIQIAAFCRAGTYGGICYWLVEHEIGQYGSIEYRAMPRDAFLLTETGSILHFSHRNQGYMGFDTPAKHWKKSETCIDAWNKTYSDWMSINNRKMGCDIYPAGIDTEGTTAEKTGLREFLEAGGWPPILYLKLWQKVKGVENLVKTGNAGLVKDIVKTAYRFSADVKTEAEKHLDVNKVKPYEMLGLTRQEYRSLREKDMDITAEIMGQWRRYRELKKDFASFLTDRGKFGEMLDLTVKMAIRDGTSPERMERYMIKQGVRLCDMRILDDTRTFQMKLTGRQKLTEEELWPRNLQRTHDALAEQVAVLEEKEKGKQFQEGFSKVYERYQSLEWTDGNLCIVLPKSAADLMREGRVLRHCVGGYSRAHISGKDTIFFVRHYRRPERPYYTLDINLTGRPREVQLHGYGNERHGKNKQYRHSIPKEVRIFCDRWKNEVLMPFYLNNQKTEKEQSA